MTGHPHAALFTFICVKASEDTKRGRFKIALKDLNLESLDLGPAATISVSAYEKDAKNTIQALYH